MSLNGAQLWTFDAPSRDCPMLSVALRTRVEARLLPAAGPAPQPQQHRGCSPVLGLKHSIEWTLPQPTSADCLDAEDGCRAALRSGDDAGSFCAYFNVTHPLPSSDW